MKGTSERARDFTKNVKRDFMFAEHCSAGGKRRKESAMAKMYLIFILLFAVLLLVRLLCLWLPI